MAKRVVISYTEPKHTDWSHDLLFEGTDGEIAFATDILDAGGAIGLSVGPDSLVAGMIEDIQDAVERALVMLNCSVAYAAQKAVLALDPTQAAAAIARLRART